MKILTVGYLHGAGGAERQIILLSNQMAQRGHDVTLCVLSEYKSKYKIEDNVNVVDLTGVEKGGLSILRRLTAFRNLVAKVCPNVIINYNLQSAYFCLTIPKKLRGKVVYSERGDPYDDEYSGILGKLRDFTVPRMDGLVFQSEGARDFFPDKVKDKSIVIHNSVNVPQDNFGKIASSFPEYTLDIYGDGPLKEELQKQINSLGLTERIHLNVSRKDVWQCIYTASLFVLTSDYEGMPNALMEAMALGLPCISTDCRPGGARTLIDNGINGYIVPLRDEEALAERISYILSHYEEAKKIATEAMTLKNTHSEEVIFEKWNNYLSNLVV